MYQSIEKRSTLSYTGRSPIPATEVTTMPAPKSKTVHQKLQELRLPTPTPKRKTPVWEGPTGSGPNGGVTFSLLSRYLTCPERFRVRVVEGLKPADAFNHRIEYGNMWHVCEEELAVGGATEECIPCDMWESLERYCQELLRKYPTQQEQVAHWYEVCRTQFPVYVDYWSKHPDVTDRTPLLQEQVFDVPYELPSGRTVRLRGKWDSVDLIGKGKDAGVYLQENKTKGDIDEQQFRRQLTFDLQTMLYLVTLGESDMDGRPIRGVRYNVVRRPLSGGEGQIVQKKGSKNVPAETADEFYARLRSVIDGTGINSKGEPYTGPSFWFMRWKVEIMKADVEVFRRQCLDPILENLTDDYEWWAWQTGTGNNPYGPFGVYNGEVRAKQLPHHHPRHWRKPFGVVDYVTEYGYGDIDEYLATGSEVGMRRVDDLFPELKE